MKCLRKGLVLLNIVWGRWVLQWLFNGIYFFLYQGLVCIFHWKDTHTHTKWKNTCVVISCPMRKNAGKYDAEWGNSIWNGTSFACEKSGSLFCESAVGDPLPVAWLLVVIVKPEHPEWKRGQSAWKLGERTEPVDTSLWNGTEFLVFHHKEGTRLESYLPLWPPLNWTDADAKGWSLWKAYDVKPWPWSIYVQSQKKIESLNDIKV